jgi:hypothetical protein
MGLSLLLAGWGVLDRLYPAASEASVRISPADPLPSPFYGSNTVGQTAVDALATVVDPPRNLVTPFVEMFAVEAPPGAFWHAVFSALWVAVVWGIIGGAIARIAVVELATGERVGFLSALRFAVRKGAPLIGAPLTPMLGVAFFTAWCALMGVFYRIPSSAVHSVLGVFAFLPLLAGLVMAIILLGLAAGWPLMHATVAAESEDTFDALSRSYAYVYQRPGHYLAYAALAWVLGAIGLLVVSLFARATVKLALWGLSFGAPDDLLLSLFQPAMATDQPLPVVIHSQWIGFVSLLAYGWVYSYFWTASTVIYLLLRHDVDGTDWNDIVQSEPETPTASPQSPPNAEPATTQPLANLPDQPAGDSVNQQS